MLQIGFTHSTWTGFTFPFSYLLLEQFNKITNDHGHTQKCEFSVLDRKHPSWANLAQTIKIVSLS